MPHDGGGEAVSGFSPPKGIRCFSTRRTVSICRMVCVGVSVPRRGFVVYLLVGFLAVTVVEYSLTFMFQSPEGDSLFFYSLLLIWWSRLLLPVSVPRRGFVVFLRDTMTKTSVAKF